jgi:excisionase family DNA binding protein
LPEELLTPKEISAWLRVSVGWVLAHANGNRAPLLPSVKMGKHRRFRREDVQRFIDECAKLATRHGSSDRKMIGGHE